MIQAALFDGPIPIKELAAKLESTIGSVRAAIAILRRAGASIECRGGVKGHWGKMGKYYLTVEPNREFLSQKVGLYGEHQVMTLPLPPPGWEPR